MSETIHDAIVVGSGAGGAAAASALAQSGLKVIMLEKGDHLPTDGSTLDIDRVVHAGEFLSREDWLDGRGNRIRIRPEEHFNVGGKTKWYGAALLRFAEEEFRPDPVHRCAGWPLTRADLDPYYREAERLLGVTTFDREASLARILDTLAARRTPWRAERIPLALKPELPRDAREARHFDGFASVAGLKGEADASIISRLRNLPNFTLRVNAEVHSLLGSPGSPSVVTGVQLCDGRELRAPLVVLAAGALHSPRVLARYLRSSGLEATLPAAAHVGRNLKLHLLTAMVALSARPVDDLIRKTVLITHEAYAHSSVQPLGFDAELMGTLVPRIVPRFLRRQIGARSYGFFLQTEDGSHPDNRVLDDRAGIRWLDYDESRVPEAAREHRRFCAAFRRALASCGMLGITRRIGLTGTAHACGSLICGRSPADSVVDANGQVHGMEGLFVADGSILPRSSRVNPSLTIYAWGLRLGTLLARRYAPSAEHRIGRAEVTHA